MPARPTLPIGLYLKDRRVVVVGDGAIADERANRLDAAGASIIRVSHDEYDSGALREASAVFAVGPDRDANRQVASDGRAMGLLTYAHDDPEASDFAMPALARCGALSIAISTDATAPALSGQLRRELERVLDGAGAPLLELLDELAAMREESPRNMSELKRSAARLKLEGELKIEKP